MATTTAVPTAPPAAAVPAARPLAPRWVAWVLFAVGVLVGLAGLVFGVLAGDSRRATGWGSGTIPGFLALMSPFAASLLVGFFLARKRPENLIGWLFLFVGATWMFQGAAAVYALWTGLEEPGVLPGAVVADWVALWAWMPGIMLLGTVLPLAFPDGRLHGWRRRFAIVVVATTLGGMLGAAFGDEMLTDLPLPNPYRVDSLSWLWAALDRAFALFMVLILISVVDLAVRFRRSTGQRRQQIKWLLFAVAIAGLGIALAGELTPSAPPYPLWARFLQDVGTFGFMGLPIATGIAILRYRLFDVDLIISKTVVFGLLAAFITGIYVAIVVGIGAAVGSSGNRVLPIVAAAVIAVAFQPARARAHDLANRFVYGERASPYEVVSEFAQRMGATVSAEDVLSRMATLLAAGIGATRAEVWIRRGSELRLAAAHPAGEAAPVPLNGDGSLPALPGADRAVPVIHQDELLGALAVAKPTSEPLTRAEEALLVDLASQAGLVLRNVRLTSELLDRLDELRASRQRLVAAQDTERRRLERNIHDGAQQQLVALAVKVRLAQGLVPKDPDRATAMMGEIGTDLTDALGNLRDLARGIYPPLLADAGLPAALRAQANKSPVPTEVAGDSVGRYPQQVEAAVYFSCLEALQNAAKYAEATRVRIGLSADGEVLRFRVEDDGRGFDPVRVGRGSGLQNIADRLAALGGDLEIRSAPARGTTLAGWVPAIPA